MGFKAKKLLGYIREDRLHRVQSYVEKYGSSITKIPLDHRGRNALHLACRYSSVYCFGYLLKHKPNLMKTDSDGNLSLHWSLTAIQKGQRFAYSDIVLPLLKLCPASKDIPNKRGVTARSLLTDMGLNIEDPSQLSGNRDCFDESNNSSLDDDDDVHDSDEKDSNYWRQKLDDEMRDEYEEIWGRYNQYSDDDYNNCSEPETYDSWTNRMSSEYYAKHRRNNSEGHFEKRTASEQRSGGGTSTDWSRVDQQYFEEQHRNNRCAPRPTPSEQDIKCRLLQLKLKFVMKYSKLFHSGNNSTIRLQDLPWMDFMSSQEIVDVLLADVDETDQTARKRCLREQQVQWHPDKFLQKCGSRLSEVEKPEILAAVNQFSQIVNAALNTP